MDRTGIKADWAQLRRRLLAWYRRHRRELPWRAFPIDPYMTLVSEAMLQQTQVSTVVPYFERFVRRFPTVEALATADVDDVLPYWAGLGYYRRCHNLHAAARIIARDCGGRVPSTVDDLMALPGIGCYTAGAIASIAFNRRVPAVDGNTRRVLARLLGRNAADPSLEEQGLIRSFAASWVSPHRPGDFNQALMELGSRICTPRRPNCDACPLRRGCRAANQLQAPGLAGRPRRGPRPELKLITVAIQRGGRLLYHRRRDTGLWSGLWEWPTETVEEGREPLSSARRLVASVLPSCRGKIRWLGELTHLLTHRRVTFYAFRVRTSLQTGSSSGWRWVPLEGEGGLPVSRAQARLVAILRDSLRCGRLR
jgi:A/G-specific adenine glycosylase